MKKNILSPKNLEGRMTLFYIFVNLWNVWLKRRQLDSKPCSSFSLVTYCCGCNIFKSIYSLTMKCINKGNSNFIALSDIYKHFK